MSDRVASMEAGRETAGDFLEAGLRLTERELLRGRFVHPAEAPRGPGERLAAAENYLAEILADPEMASAGGSFLPALLGRPGPETIGGDPPEDFLPWGHTRPAGAHIQSPASCAFDDASPEEGLPVRDFFGRAAALQAGAALVGAAALDEDFLYARALDGRLIRRTDGADFTFGPDAISLPRRADRVLMLGFVRAAQIMGPGPALLRLRPPRGWVDWPGQLAAVRKLAAWLTAQGFLALPAAAGLLSAPHYGVLAGLGELGRQGLLITPEYGPNLRLFTLLTDYPFIADQPVAFGAADYCETCRRCIGECPARALAEGPRRSGLYPWPVDRRACFNYCLEKRDPCRRCIEVCPYTRESLVGQGRPPAPATA